MQTAFSTDGARSPCRRPAPPEATFQPFSRPRGPRGRLAGRLPLAARSARRAEPQPQGRRLRPRSKRHRGARWRLGQVPTSPFTEYLGGAGEPSPPEPFAAAPSEPPQPCRLPVTSHRFCSCPASEPAAYRLPTGPPALLGLQHVVLSAMPSGSAPSLREGHHAHPRLTLPRRASRPSTLTGIIGRDR